MILFCNNMGIHLLWSLKLWLTMWVTKGKEMLKYQTLELFNVLHLHALYIDICNLNGSDSWYFHLDLTFVTHIVSHNVRDKSRWIPLLSTMKKFWESPRNYRVSHLKLYKSKALHLIHWIKLSMQHTLLWNNCLLVKWFQRNDSFPSTLIFLVDEI